LDADGELIREFSSGAPDPPRPTVFAGANRFVWDLRYPAPQPLEERPEIDQQRVQADQAATAARVLAGGYRVRLTVGGPSYAPPLEIVPDPRLDVPADDLAAQLRLK